MNSYWRHRRAEDYYDISPPTYYPTHVRRSRSHSRLSPSIVETTSSLSQRIDEFLSKVTSKELKIQNKKKNVNSRKRSGSRDSKKKLDYPIPDVSKIKSTLIGSKNYQGPAKRTYSSRRTPTRFSNDEKPRWKHTDESSQDSAYAGDSRQNTPEFRRKSIGFVRKKQNIDSNQVQYLKCLNDLTTDILYEGAYTSKSLNKLVDKHLNLLSDRLSKRELAVLSLKLRKDLGMRSCSPRATSGRYSDSSTTNESLIKFHSTRKKHTSNNSLRKSVSCDSLQKYSDAELYSLLKGEAGLDGRLVKEVIRTVRYGSTSSLAKQPQEEEYDYRDDEFEEEKDDEESDE